MEPNNTGIPAGSSPITLAVDYQPQSMASPAAMPAAPATEPSTGDDAPTPPTSAGWLDFVGVPKIVDRLYQGARGFWAAAQGQVGKLSPAQQVAGAVALAGFGYLTLRKSKSGTPAAAQSAGPRTITDRTGAAPGFRGRRA